MSISYDEIFISTKREIKVCEHAIRKLKEELADRERNWQMTPHEPLGGFGRGDGGCAGDAPWRNNRSNELKDLEKRLSELRAILIMFS